MSELQDVVDHLTGPDGEFPVGQEDINGISYKVFLTQTSNLREYFIRAGQFGETPFLVYEDERYTFAETLGKAARLAHALRSEYNLRKGDRVAIAMRNYPEWIFSLIAITVSGGVVVPMNSWWTADEFEYGLQDCGAKIVICDVERADLFKGFQDKLNLSLIVAKAGDAPLAKGAAHFDDVIEGLRTMMFPNVPIHPDDDASILYTSGSTGHPKGVVSTHRGILSTLTNWGVMGVARSVVAGTFGEVPERQPATLMSVPLFHVTGCHSIFLLSMSGGRKVVLMYKWDPIKAFELIEREEITNFLGVPTMSFEMLQHPEREKYNLSSLLEMSSGGAARPPEHVKLITEKMPESPPTTGYGLTETNALGALLSGEDYVAKPNATGYPTKPLIEMKLMDEAGREVPTGERGEIWIKSTANFRAYWNNPEATAEAFTDGWFHSGDIAYFDEDGVVFIVDRAKDIVIRGGENISCLEVEAALYEHGDVFEAAVYGVPDERLGEELAVSITPKPGVVLDADDLRAHVRQRIASFKVPRYIWFHEEQLPRTATGKIFKRQLREDAAEAMVKAS